MAITAAEIQAKFTTKGADEVKRDITGVGGAVDAVRGKLTSWGSTARTTGTWLTAGLTAPIVGFFTKAIGGASSLEQAQGKVDAVFKNSADVILAWSGTTSRAIGVSQTQALQWTGTIGNFFTSAGMASDSAAKMSKDFVNLSADMAAFNDVSAARASDALISGLAGEYDSLQRLGVNITAAKVDQEALNIATAEGRTEVTEADKALARYNVIMRESANQHGQSKREAKGLEGQLARLRARFSEVAARIGKDLMPTAIDLVDTLRDLVEWVGDLNPAVQRWAVIIAAAAAALGPLLIGIGLVLPGLSVLLGLFAALVSPIGLVLAAAGLLAFAFRDELGAALNKLIDTVTFGINVFRNLREAGLDPVQALTRTLITLFPQFTSVIVPVMQAVRNLGDAFDALKRGDYANMFSELAGAARNVGSAIWAAIGLIDWGGIAGALWSGITGAVSWVGQQVLDIPSIAVSIGKWAITTLSDLWGDIKRKVYGWLGGTPAGDGTGGATGPGGGSQDIPIGTLTIMVGGWLVEQAGNLYETLKAKIFSWVGGGDGVSGGGLTAGIGLAGGGIPIGTLAVMIGDWALDQAKDLAAAVKSKVIEWVGRISLTSTDVITVGRKLMDAVVDAVDAIAQSGADLAAKLLTWITDQIESVDWNSAGRTFADLLEDAIKSVALLVGISGYLLGQVLLALVDVDWSAAASAFGQFFVAAIKGIGNFLIGFGSELLGDLMNELASIDWGAVGDTIKQFLVNAVKGVGTAVWDAIFGELPTEPVIKEGDWKDTQDPATADQDWGGFLGKGAGGRGRRNNLTGGGAGGLGAQIGAMLDEVTATIRTKTAEWSAALTAGVEPLGAIAAAVFGGIPVTANTQLGATAGIVATQTGAMSATSNANFLGMQTGGIAAVTALGAGVLGSIGATAGGWAGSLAGMLGSARTHFTGMNTTGTANTAQLGANVGSNVTSMQQRSGAAFGTMASQGIAETGRMRGGVIGQAAAAAGGVVSELTSGGARAVAGFGGQIGRLAGVVSGAGGAAIGAASSLGSNVGGALADALDGMYGRVSAAASRLASAAAAAMAAALEVHSPSRFAIWLAEMVGQGLIIGFDRMRRPVGSSATGLADTVTTALVPSVGFGGSPYAGTVPYVAGGGLAPRGDVHISITIGDIVQQPGEDGEALARRIGTEIEDRTLERIYGALTSMRGR